MSRSISGELSKKIILSVGVLVIGGIIGISIFSGRIVTQFANKNAESSLNTFTKEVEDNLHQIEDMASSVRWIALDHFGDSAYISAMGRKVSMHSAMLTHTSINFTPENDVEKDVFDKKKIIWSEPYANAEGIPAVLCSSPLADAQGNVFAVFSSEVSIPELSKKLNVSHFYDKSYAVLLSAKGNFVYHPHTDFILNKSIFDIAEITSDKQLAEFADKMIAGEKGLGTVKAEKAVAIYGPVYNGWSVAIVCPAREIFGGTFRFQLILLIIAIFDLLLIYFVSRSIINRTLLPITEISYAAMNIGKGNFKAVLPPAEGGFELKHLHDALSYMLDSINDYIVQLKTTTSENERYESELNIASNIQKQMLRTDFIHNEELDLFATLHPAKEVGGDMYDFRLSGRSLYFAVGDVSGKGVPAALYMAISRSLFHFVSGLSSMGSNNVVSCINNSFCSGNDSNMFITLFVGRLDLDTGELLFCNAGHNPIIIISPDGKATYLPEKSNLAAGVYDEFPYEKESVMLQKGSRLLIYTDGVSEAEDKDKNQYGEDRLLSFANSQDVNLSSEAFVNNLMSSVKSFTKDNDQNDDITIMSIKI